MSTVTLFEFLYWRNEWLFATRRLITCSTNFCSSFKVCVKTLFSKFRNDVSPFMSLKTLRILFSRVIRYKMQKNIFQSYFYFLFHLDEQSQKKKTIISKGDLCTWRFSALITIHNHQLQYEGKLNCIGNCTYNLIESLSSWNYETTFTKIEL